MISRASTASDRQQPHAINVKQVHTYFLPMLVLAKMELIWITTATALLVISAVEDVQGLTLITANRVTILLPLPQMLVLAQLPEQV